MDFRSRLRTALTGAPDTPLVLLGNFEVEDEWARGERGLPRFAMGGSGRAIVNRMDELALLLAAERDHVVLKTRPEPDHLEYLDRLGLPVPHVLVPGEQDPQCPVTVDALRDPRLVTTLSTLDGRLAPHGVSTAEEELARRTGLPLAGPPADVCKAVNSKIFSRRVGAGHGLRQAPGRTCATPEEQEEAFAWATGVLDAGGRVVLKDAYGVSGKGIAVLDDPKRLDRLRRMAGPALVVEEWVAKRTDLNYQFLVGRDGAVSFDVVKEALTDTGVHKGHRFPVQLTAAQTGELEAAATVIGGAVFRAGYYGVVGVDAMVDPDGGLYPLVEINARNNMSTYQAVVQETLVPDGAEVLARHYPVRPREPLPFAALCGLLDGLLLTRVRREGLVVTGFATVNAAPPDGRLYAMVVANSPARLAALDTEIEARLEALP